MSARNAELIFTEFSCLFLAHAAVGDKVATGRIRSTYCVQGASARLLPLLRAIRRRSRRCVAVVRAFADRRCRCRRCLPLPSPADAARSARSTAAPNNVSHPDWGRASTPYPRVTAANYADGRAAPCQGPRVRYVSNRIFNDTAQNLFSENGVTQWGASGASSWTTRSACARRPAASSAPIAFSAADPLEQFRNDFGAIAFKRTPAAPGTGTSSPRQQLNVVGGYIDALRRLRRHAGTAATGCGRPVDGTPKRPAASRRLSSARPTRAATPPPPRRWH